MSSLLPGFLKSLEFFALFLLFPKRDVLKLPIIVLICCFRYISVSCIFKLYLVHISLGLVCFPDELTLYHDIIPLLSLLIFLVLNFTFF